MSKPKPTLPSDKKQSPESDSDSEASQCAWKPIPLRTPIPFLTPIRNLSLKAVPSPIPIRSQSPNFMCNGSRSRLRHRARPRCRPTPTQNPKAMLMLRHHRNQADTDEVSNTDPNSVSDSASDSRADCKSGSRSLFQLQPEAKPNTSTSSRCRLRL